MREYTKECAIPVVGQHRFTTRRFGVRMSTELAQFLPGYTTDDTKADNVCTSASNVFSH